MSNFQKATLDELAKPLPHDMVKTRAQAGASLSYIEGWYALDTANRVFGFDGWSIEVISVTVLHSERAEGKGTYKHVARVHVRVRVGDVTRDGIGVGVGAQSDPAAAIELAEKAAETDAQKRALKSFGNRFGLALYDKAQEGVGASREAQRMIDEIASTSDVNAWVLVNKNAVTALGPGDQVDVKAAAARRRAELTAQASSARTERDPVHATEGGSADDEAGASPSPALLAFFEAAGNVRNATEAAPLWLKHRPKLTRARELSDGWAELVARVRGCGVKTPEGYLSKEVAALDAKASVPQTAAPAAH